MVDNRSHVIFDAYENHNPGTGKLTKFVLVQVEADNGVILLLTHRVNCLRLHVAEVAVLWIHEAWPGRIRGLAEGFSDMRIDVVKHQHVTVLLLETGAGRRGDRAAWSSVFWVTLWLRTFHRYAVRVDFLFFVNDACGVVALDYMKRWLVVR